PLGGPVGDGGAGGRRRDQAGEGDRPPPKRGRPAARCAGPGRGGENRRPVREGRRSGCQTHGESGRKGSCPSVGRQGVACRLGYCNTARAPDGIRHPIDNHSATSPAGAAILQPSSGAEATPSPIRTRPVNDTRRRLEQLADPAAYPHPAGPVEVRQTHISAVFLAGPFAYKLKKPVALGFLDFSTPDRRRHFCEEEVRLNRRLAPHVYLGVVPVTDEDG